MNSELNDEVERMNILISGACGHMGKEVEKLALSGFRGVQHVSGVDLRNDGSSAVVCADNFDNADTSVDCIVDFSHHTCTSQLLDFAVAHDIPLVIATTGQTPEEKEMIYLASKKIPLFYAANYSFGVALLIELAKKTAAAMPEAEIEIVETHHERKVDAPSGTALAIAEAIREVRPDAVLSPGRTGQGKRMPNEICIHSLRFGNIVGQHEVIIATNTQSITLKHEAYSRALFAEGALTAAEFLISRPAGLYNMQDMISAN